MSQTAAQLVGALVALVWIAALALASVRSFHRR
ncbi:hypothetical protein SZN_35952 [Streptomyces zinciresistens K42]|uniref:Uncharacterized protein n=1 Tax=Streptomyces zinciresistens K42 TaxID=700597 RepID=G2GNT5_9ACTN|nr:hypothetical protein SZN_35952 [Streptomyces zinciresistens K42]